MANFFGNKVKTPLFKGLFVRVFEGTAEIDAKTGKKSWGLMAAIPAGADISNLTKAIEEVCKTAWGDKVGVVMKNKNFKHPVSTGDAQRRADDGEMYDGLAEDDIVLKLRHGSKAPGIVDRLARKIADENGATLVDKKNDVYDIFEANKVYSGCYFYASVVPMAFKHDDGGVGVSLRLENLQLVKQGEPLSGGGSGGGSRDAASDFGVIEGADSDDLSNLLGV